ncbi:MAG: DUF4294 domain-containing protein [Bacteroidota bacterium]
MSFIFLSEWTLAQEGTKDSVAISAATSEKYGAHDTVLVPAMIIEGELVGGRYLSDLFIWGGNPKDLAKYMEKWDRLKRAVYVTYPYARSAGVVMSDILKHLDGVDSRSERRKYIRSREQELRKAFGNQIMDLSIYQGKVLMKLIHRQTGENCYEIIKEMKGGVTARFYQTIMFFVGSSLRQNWNPMQDNTDRLIESFVQEMDQVYAPSASYRYNSAVRQ